jgi:NAD(P)-dependent dehydrogenase (short-subunit alcohol dehydrogenase family)
LAKFGRIDVFFNNAGVEGKVQSIVDTTADNLDHVLGVNLYGVYYGLKYVLKVMIEQLSGSVINVASVAGLKGFPNLAPYVASKHAVLGITRSAALEVVGKGVRVNAICPAPVDTRMMRSIEEAMSEDPAAVRKIFEESIPMGRYATAQEIAELVYFLASTKSSYITGGIYPIDGGTMAK